MQKVYPVLTCCEMSLFLRLMVPVRNKVWYSMVCQASAGMAILSFYPSCVSITVFPYDLFRVKIPLLLLLLLIIIIIVVIVIIKLHWQVFLVLSWFEPSR